MRLTAVEVLQTSAMDCGPAALASLLASLGRDIDLQSLRDACRTDLDGTSIDVIEEVARNHGLSADQHMLPEDRLADHLPAIAVVRLPDGAPHFVTVWRRLGPFVQVMDPARGGYWVRLSRFRPNLMRHALPVSAAAWIGWAKDAENLAALRHMARRIGLAETHVDSAAAEPGWFPIAALEAAMRLTLALPRPSAALTLALLAETRASEADIFRLIPPGFWPVIPDAASTRVDPQLTLQGAVLLSVSGLAQTAKIRQRRRPPSLLRTLFRGALPLALVLGTVLAVLGTLAEALAFRHLIQPQGGFGVALALVGALYLRRLALGSGVLALGRRVELQWRQAVMAKLLRLPDRWLSSRALGDLAERAQSLHLVRAVPGMVLHLVQAVTEVLALCTGLLVIAPDGAPWVLGIAALSLGWPMVVLPLLRDRDLTLRSLGAAQAVALMDALQGRGALRAHRGEATLTARFATLLADWQAAARSRAGVSAAAGALGQAMVLSVATGAILARPEVDLLFLWWLMKLPGSAADLSAVFRQLPAQEAILARLAEPLQTPDRPLADPPPALAMAQALGITLKDADVTASGHPVLKGVTVAIAPGEAVAVVGASGSGKSSLLGLILGWHDLSRGCLEVNGQTLTAAESHGLRRRIAWVDPTSRLWGATIADTPGDPERVDLTLPPDTPVGAGGALLSAGEGQRLRLARALAHPDPALILCDEALRGLDAPRRRQLLARARQHWQGRTLIWVTHDLNEAMQFDRVIVMADGRIAEDGAPGALLAQGGAFTALWQAQAAMARRMARDWQRLPVESFREVADVQPGA